ncbi:MAG: hypothetical protein KC583_07645, partial [Myxococcales bacterium]|nr:hypothetical protein [Myxococcales bacterium]
MSTPARAVGIDFGTTNSTVAVCEPDGRVRLARFPLPQIVAGIDDAAAAETFRSVLYFRAPEPRRPPQAEAGPGAIDAFLDEGEGRLMKSLKTFL